MVITFPIKDDYSGGAHGRLRAEIAEDISADSPRPRSPMLCAGTSFFLPA